MLVRRVCKFCGAVNPVTESDMKWSCAWCSRCQEVPVEEVEAVEVDETDFYDYEIEDED